MGLSRFTPVLLLLDFSSLANNFTSYHSFSADEQAVESSIPVSDRRGNIIHSLLTLHRLFLSPRLHRSDRAAQRRCFPEVAQ